MQNALSFVGFVPPDENDLVKRVIATGGQTVECRQSTGLTVDGKPLNEPYLNLQTMDVPDPGKYRCLGFEFGPVTVPEGRLWVMGDNRTHSADSRVHCADDAADFQSGIKCTGDPTPAPCRWTTSSERRGSSPGRHRDGVGLARWIRSPIVGLR